MPLFPASIKLNTMPYAADISLQLIKYKNH